MYAAICIVSSPLIGVFEIRANTSIVVNKSTSSIPLFFVPYITLVTYTHLCTPYFEGYQIN